MTAVALPLADHPAPAEVLSKAVVRAAERLGLSHARLARVLGVSPATITRLYAGDYRLAPARKEWELALLLVRAFRSLDSLVGEETTARRWLSSENRALNGRPLELIGTTEGLVRVVQYLDASRGLA
jgi:DNA-binding XRE family transcriptional regulator